MDLKLIEAIVRTPGGWVLTVAVVTAALWLVYCAWQAVFIAGKALYLLAYRTAKIPPPRAAGLRSERIKLDAIVNIADRTRRMW